jgi:hypothetical protein
LTSRSTQSTNLCPPNSFSKILHSKLKRLEHGGVVFDPAQRMRFREVRTIIQR